MFSISVTCDVWDLIKRFGIGGVLGALVGIGLVIWIDPTTSEGQGLVFVVGVLVTVLAVEVGRLICCPLRRDRPLKTSQVESEDIAAVETRGN